MAIGGSALSTPNPQPLAERWNGQTWTILPIPAPAGAQGVLIGPVSCTSPSACTTTGVSFNSSGVGTTVAERWNGRAWHIQATPNPRGAQGAALMGVTCTGPSACLAVGAANPFPPNAKTLTERWNGARWSIVASPNPPGGGTFNAVSCASPTACTGIGYSNSGTTLAERWNGIQWRIQPTPNPVAAFQVTLDGVACPARRSCTAVGDYEVNGTGGERVTLGLQWDGTGQGLRRSAAPSHPGASCAGRPAAPDRLWWRLADGGPALAGPRPGLSALAPAGLGTPQLPAHPIPAARSCL
jgi:hypothetical protein